jgi:hypothetical protein
VKAGAKTSEPRQLSNSGRSWTASAKDLPNVASDELDPDIVGKIGLLISAERGDDSASEKRGLSVFIRR